MELAEAIEIVVARTKHERFRALCDPDHPDFNPGYASLVIAMATGEPPPAGGATAAAGAVPQEVAPLASIPMAGDIVAAMTKRLGVDRFTKFVTAKLGVDCGCSSRQEALNRLDAKLRRFLSR